MLSYWFLLKFPWYVVLPVLYGATIAILWPIRAIFEGRAYNHSFTSVVGCFGLVMAITIGGDVLKRMGHVDGIMGTAGFHTAIMILVIAFGISWQHLAPGPAGDAFHNQVSVPILLYFLITVLPATHSETNSAKAAVTLVCTTTWLICYWIDEKTGRLKNAKYEADNFRRKAP